MEKEIRKYYPVLCRRFNGKRLIYFDNACSLLKSQSVINAVRMYYENLGGCAGGRSDHILAQKTEEACEKARNEIKEFIHARHSDEIIWTKNTTEGINLIASSLAYTKRKNEVITFNIEHHSDLLPFYEAQKKQGIKLRVLNVQRDGRIDLDALKKAVSDKTALVSLAHSSNVLSIIQPVKEIARLAHIKGAYILVDDAQYIATHAENVVENDIDFMVFSGHKIGSPGGIGVLYGKRYLLKKLKPYQVGGGTVESVELDRFNALKVKYLPAPRGFEAGVQHYAGIIGIGAAAAFLKHIGHKRISSQVESLTRYLYEELLEIEGVKILGDYDAPPKSSLLSFYFTKKSASLRDFNIFLNEGLKRVCILVRCGHHCALPIHQYFGQNISMRLSFFVYNTTDEIDIFVRTIKGYLKETKR